MGERGKAIGGCILFSLPSSQFLEVETSKGYCNFVVIIIPLKPWLVSLVFHTEFSGFSFFSGWKSTPANLLIDKEGSTSFEGVKQ